MQFTETTFNQGSHSFTETIINQYSGSKIEQNDIELLNFIAGVSTEETLKQSLGKDVAIVNDNTIPTEIRENSHSRITQFLLNHKSDIIAWAGRVSKIVITAILAKYGLSLADVGLDKS